MSITIEKIELQAPHTYIDPFITVSVKSQFVKKALNTFVASNGSKGLLFVYRTFV